MVDRILGRILGKTSSAMRMKDEAWMRHANPWSFATRPPTILHNCLLVSRVDRLFFLIPLAVIAAWTFLNPRVFPKPRSTRNRASKGVFGERIMVSRREYCVEIPEHHVKAAFALTMLSLAGAILLFYGIVALEPLTTVAGCITACFGMLWYVDRMVWLFEDLKDHPVSKNWVY
ncbi:hypothetical protein IMZ38_01715 [Thermosphaera chiliense]|uniref:Uncharacterized protein n=1 Tax=Thermosphaera chiliense TaxID=3402707 RepID=A0A7M1URT3_9CREN|nr:DUF6653 family protein [Thermosphaera aggregans]QOR94679.1 hypothetical protein IMZ38_01715 [Thermosphaera aggregans]